MSLVATLDTNAYEDYHPTLKHATAILAFALSLVAEEYDSYIIVSFVNATLVLSIGETVEEVTDSGFLGTTPTLSCHALGSDALVQVYPDGIRHIRADKRVNEWKAPGKKSIVRCAVNSRQVVIALTGGELVYFEMDPVSKRLFASLDYKTSQGLVYQGPRRKVL